MLQARAAAARAAQHQKRVLMPGVLRMLLARMLLGMPAWQQTIAILLREIPSGLPHLMSITHGMSFGGFVSFVSKHSYKVVS
jgi:hypothetical protein